MPKVRGKRLTRKIWRSIMAKNQMNNNLNATTTSLSINFNNNSISSSNALLTSGNSSSICYDDICRATNETTSNTNNSSRVMAQSGRQKRCEYFDRTYDNCTTANDNNFKEIIATNENSDMKNEQQCVVVNPAVLRYLEQNRSSGYQRSDGDNTSTELKNYISSVLTTSGKLSATNTTATGDFNKLPQRSSATPAKLWLSDVVSDNSLFTNNDTNSSPPLITSSHAFFDILKSFSSRKTTAPCETLTKRATIEDNSYTSSNIFSMQNQQPPSSSSTQHSQIHHSTTSLVNTKHFSTDINSIENMFDRSIENATRAVVNAPVSVIPTHIHYHHYLQQLQYIPRINKNEILELDKLVQDDLFWDFCCSNDFITSSMLVEYILSKEKKYAARKKNVDDKEKKAQTDTNII
ncbi:unnamed protein product [Didymodactylos carnosus]|uniref:Uncharacterized protein n=1 Tax=Didymodactylos carnosus TaxID=1234261 RepID=A0A813XX40_9BILA|nr:unnamed protein product [Didymodactylos carnosus]CAF0879833.1 unnamed protein product [Didymodactylos carnosus]CAF3660463.1 unnamed protein product [Didymodactylos carnosus]CAF3666200.1 unnamed protein product [Didymodactylos carnosus]